MKKVKRIILAVTIGIIILTFNYCNLNSPEDLNTIPFQEIDMDCIDKVSVGGKFEIVINSQEEYEELIYQRYEKPLADYWNKHYESILQSVKEKNPGMTNEEYEKMVRDVFYSALPFSGVKNCIQPEIDFNKYTLLGQDAFTGGCEQPVYKIAVKKYEDKKEYLFSLHVTRIGHCDMAVGANKWLLIPKIEQGYEVRFEKTESYK